MEAFDPNLPNPIQKPQTWTSVLFILCKSFAAELLVGCFCGCLAASGLLLGCLAAPGCFWAAAMIRRKKYTTNNVHYMYHCIVIIYSPHLCVGFLFLVVRSRVLPPPPSPPPPPPGLPPPHTTCSHTTCSHTTCSHTTYSHTTYSHTTCPHTHSLLTHTTSSQLVHRLTHSLSTHNLLTQSLFTHNLVTHSLFTHNIPTHTTYSHTTCPRTTYSHTQLAHTQLAHTQLAHTQLTHSHTLPRLFVRQAWHLATSAFTLRGRRGTWRHRRAICLAGGALIGTGLALVAGLGRVWRRCCRMLPRLFVWQAWRLATSTFTLRGRHGAGDINVHSVWQVWRLWYWAGSSGALGPRLAPLSSRLFVRQAWHLATSAFTLCGRRGTWRHRRAICLAGAALIGTGLALVAGLGRVWRRCCRMLQRLFVWQAWRLATSTFTLRGRHGAWRHQRAFCVAGVALMVLGWLQWRAWAAFGAVVVAALCAAGVALGDIDVHSAWQVWRLWYWAGSGGALGPRLAPLSPRLFVWQTCRLATSTCILRGSLSQVSAKKQTPVCLLWATV